ncbi:MAG TPA: ethanolamine ammonia-lyase subunit EutC [Bryobacteraceae bacterium]|nr:ethanolamine ammonia-lyase subunit EutC [Bryobacteraceae bacterium]
MIENPWTKLRELTAARIALGRAGHSLPTRELLAFQLAHAKARDAVHRNIDVAAFASLRPVLLHSAATDRATYLRRPDLGRRLNADSANRLKRDDWDVALIAVDGLSATAVHRHAVRVIEALQPLIEDWRVAPVCVVEQGRVAIGDEIGEGLGAKLAIVLIGERPGLSSPDSLGAYLTWSPRIGRTDAERNCVSNIRADGLEPALAAERIAMIMRAALEQQLTGVHLKISNLLN